MVARSKIKTDVIYLLAVMRRINPKSIEETHSLIRDFDWPASFLSTLARPYTHISEYYDGQSISRPAARSATTVKKAIDLVFKAANRKLK
jgi:hypothetical protein